VKRWNWVRVQVGVQLFLMGCFKKMAIADRMAVFCDPIFKNPEQYSTGACWIAVLAYALRIYCDFSGYSDMAVGLAHLFGYKLINNFNMPYIAQNVTEFWRRWHISLSTWLRDYLYVPLGGNRKGSRRTYVNLMLTMLLGGLWHGASWTFVAWGSLHGAALGVTRAYQRRWPSSSRPTAAGTLAAAALTFHFVCAAWIFFRAETFQKAATLFAQLATLTTFRPNLYPEVIAVLGVGLLSHWVPERWYTAIRVAFIRMPAPAQGLALCAAAITIREMASAEAVPFVYFQF
jgi:D-alanyl-lipoteichoic acid acyltransferase DltB (MBOAT superfamily)